MLVPLRDISTAGTGTLIIGPNRFEHVQYQISGTKRSRTTTDSAQHVVDETVLSADLHGEILGPSPLTFMAFPLSK